MYEWNPCRDEDGIPAVFQWDDEVGAYDVEMESRPAIQQQPLEVERWRLRELLDDLLFNETRGGALDLQPIRKFIAKLMQTSGRHTEHGTGDPWKGCACAEGSGDALKCRYGHPHKMFCRACGMKIEKGDREGQWFPRFPRNDELAICYEPHLFMTNDGNIDWRPCLN